jgi:hypothetical protein
MPAASVRKQCGVDAKGPSPAGRELERNTRTDAALEAREGQAAPGTGPLPPVASRDPADSSHGGATLASPHWPTRPLSTGPDLFGPAGTVRRTVRTDGRSRR